MPTIRHPEPRWGGGELAELVDVPAGHGRGCGCRRVLVGLTGARCRAVLFRLEGLMPGLAL
jgi:hypothetical protein